MQNILFRTVNNTKERIERKQNIITNKICNNKNTASLKFRKHLAVLKNFLQEDKCIMFHTQKTILGSKLIIFF